MKWLVAASLFIALAPLAWAVEPCKVTIIDDENDWPVPLIELRTTNQQRFISDNAGVIAIDDPSLMKREVWFTVIGHGYGVKADGFGFRGVRLTPEPGGSLTVKITRSAIARRVGRLTGGGLFAESQKLGEAADWRDSPVLGCDSIQMAKHRGRVFWMWGDTNVAAYPLGVFDMTCATTSDTPFESFQPPLRPRFEYFLKEKGKPKGVAPMPGKGPTWVTGFVSLPDRKGDDHLVGFYRKIKPPLSTYEAGLCVWNDETEEFEHLKTVWKESDGGDPPTLTNEGHPAFYTDDEGKRWLLFGNPLPRVRLPATFEAWRDETQWEALSPPKTLPSAKDGKPVELHSGSIAWCEHKKKWVAVFVQIVREKPASLSTLWYSEADTPLGEWSPAVEVLSHENYTFYNPRLHPELAAPDEPILLFEGTYTAMFANHARPTARYDYNQILYSIDLTDPRLKTKESQ